MELGEVSRKNSSGFLSAFLDLHAQSPKRERERKGEGKAEGQGEGSWTREM